MKHILNNLSEEEKNAIREQHTGGMKVMTENFNKLINSKLGDAKPLVSEQPVSRPPTRPSTSGTTTIPTTSFTNKTVNLYNDYQNTDFDKKVTIRQVRKMDSGRVHLYLDNDTKLLYNCLFKNYLKFQDKDSNETPVFNARLIIQLAKTFCATSSGGASVPNADFATNSSNTGEDFA